MFFEGRPKWSHVFGREAKMEPCFWEGGQNGAMFFVGGQMRPGFS